MNTLIMPTTYKCMLLILSVNIAYFLGYVVFYFSSSNMEVYTLSGMQANILSSVGFEQQDHPRLNFVSAFLIFIVPFSLMALSLFLAVSKQHKLFLIQSLSLSMIFGGGIFCLFGKFLVVILLMLPSTARYYESLKANSLLEIEKA